MNEQGKKVKQFFDRSVSNYRARKSSFTNFYFSRRLELAIALAQPGLHASILDIGCGTGLLYDALLQRDKAGYYLGIDISAAMLAHSKIPPDQQQQIDIQQFITNNDKRYDLIFALGFTTYLKAETVSIFHKSLADLLKPGGKAIISYTHAKSYDLQLRELIRNNFGKVLSGKKSLGRDFEIFASTPVQLKASLPATLHLEELKWLPPAVPLLSSLFDIKINNTSSRWGERWRGDFLVSLTALS